MPNKTHRILLFNSSPQELKTLVSALQSSPFRLIMALSESQLRARAISSAPHLILLDSQSSRDPDWLTTPKLLYASPKTHHIPVILLTPPIDASARIKALQTGAVDHIAKPFDAQEVITRINLHLSLIKRYSSCASTESTAPEAAQTWRPVSQNDHTLLRIACEIITTRLTYPPNLTELALTLKISKRRVQCLFQNYLGKTLFQYIRDQRMHKAAILLAEAAIPVTEVAIEMGYSTAANFSTQFHRFWGKPPSSFKLDHLNNELPSHTDSQQAFKALEIPFSSLPSLRHPSFSNHSQHCSLCDP